MILNLNDDEYFENPTADVVRTVITSLYFDHFAILGRGDENYIQTYHNEDGTFQLEVRDGSADEHYAADVEDLKAEDVATAFAAYLENRDSWKQDWAWEKVEFDDDVDLTADNAYMLNGEAFKKIAVGEEQGAAITRDGQCTECNAKAGEYHDEACGLEECPRCHERLQGCDCE